jgi:X-X-X-Leu-X-X-Gly heptad repeat protein
MQSFGNENSRRVGDFYVTGKSLMVGINTATGGTKELAGGTGVGEPPAQGG